MRIFPDWKIQRVTELSRRENLSIAVAVLLLVVPAAALAADLTPSQAFARHLEAEAQQERDEAARAHIETVRQQFLLPVAVLDLGDRSVMVSIVDGDTLKTSDGVRLRLWGIDTPEVCEPFPCGEGATAIIGLYYRIKDLQWTCTTRDVDRYSRPVIQCVTLSPKMDLAAEMVRAGYARDWPEYSKGAYARDELLARVARAGYWNCINGETPAAWVAAKKDLCPTRYAP